MTSLIGLAAINVLKKKPCGFGELVQAITNETGCITQAITNELQELIENGQLREIRYKPLYDPGYGSIIFHPEMEIKFKGKELM